MTRALLPRARYSRCVKAHCGVVALSVCTIAVVMSDLVAVMWCLLQRLLAQGYKEEARFHRRKPWLAAIARRKRDTPVPAIDGVDPDVVSLLLDRRLLVCRGPLVASAQVGFAVSFMHECCEDPQCPTVQPYVPTKVVF